MINCILIPKMEDIGIIYNEKSNFYYDRKEYLRDKIIIDLPVEFIKDERYKSYCNFLVEKGFNILLKGEVKSLDFGLPVYTKRCVIVASKNTNNPIYHYIVSNGNGYVTPSELLHGKLSITILKNELKKYNVDFSSDDINEMINSYMNNNYDRSLLREFLDKSCNLSDKSNKFNDGSNSLPRGNRSKIKDEIDGIRDNPLLLIKNYVHWVKKRDYMTVREIARINGISDSVDLSGISREQMIDIVNNSISPLIISRLWGALY